MNELVVFLMREFHWTYEYTVGLVKTLPIKKLNALMEELQYQKAMEEYRVASNFAMLISNWASAQSKRKYSIKDFIGQPPSRDGKEADKGLYGIAEKAGIIIPKEG